ncbi:MAG TPA: hypothetical protein VL360_02665, partial [Gammaproteobacteria bacterium]|nr:hypothetical protein [Gammaproteobacteria bacterium]
MAFDFSKLNFFSRLDARARVLVLLGAIVAIGVLIYVLVSYLSAGSATVGPSSVANAPQGLKSVPGGQLTPEYYRALMQANTQAAQQAQISGGSAVPTLVNASQQGGGTGNCTVLCGDESADVKNDLNDWVKQGKISADISAFLQDLAAKNVSEAEYAAELDRLVKEGKLTPEQARRLLEEYRKQHGNRTLDASAKSMDELIKAGKLSLGDANDLLALQKRNVSPADYAVKLQEFVASGRLDPETAQRLLNQYMQARAKEIIARSVTSIKQMTRSGQITPDIEKALVDMEERMAPVNEYESKLQSFIDAGKITPIVSSKILDEFKQQKREIGNLSSIDSLIKQAEEAAFAELRELTQSGKISQDTANQITDMIQQNVSFEQFQAEIAQMVQQGKMTTEISKLKLADYKKIKDLRDLKNKLDELQANNAPCTENEKVLKQAVQAGSLTPEQAARLLKECQNAKLQPGAIPSGETSGVLSQLQQRLQSSTTTVPVATTVATTETFETAQAQTQEQLEQQRQQRISDLVTAMQGQASQLLAAWQPPSMMHKERAPESISKSKDGTAKDGNGTGAGESKGAASTGAIVGGAPVIKGGTILFAVLDTAVNSDYPDSPVMATIVTGP